VRVAHLAAQLARTAGGLAASVPGLADALHRHTPCEVALVGARHPAFPDDWRALGAVPVHPLARVGPGTWAWTPALARTLDRLAPDIVHTHGLWTYPSLATRRWHARAGRPHIVAPHGMLDPWALRRGRLKKSLAGLWFEDAHLARAACLHALCPQEAAAVRALGLRNPVCVVPNGVALPPRPEDPGPPPAWDDLLPPGARVLLFLGRLHAKKGLVELLRGWAAVAAEAERLGWRLVVAGWDDDGTAGRLGALARDLGIGRQVHLGGPQFGAAKGAAFRRAAAFALTSRSEGLPVAVLEAWSHGLPVLMTPRCNLPEGREAGAAVEVRGDPASIADGLRRLFAATDAERGAMGARGRRLAAQRFAWPAIARRMHEVYAWALGGGPPPPHVLTD
jgi:glycosyltransferase involved in cell wall biosynthesis